MRKQPKDELVFPTPELRFFKREVPTIVSRNPNTGYLELGTVKPERVLQQKWVNLHDGTETWRDVPVVG